MTHSCATTVMKVKNLRVECLAVVSAHGDTCSFCRHQWFFVLACLCALRKAKGWCCSSLAEPAPNHGLHGCSQERPKCQSRRRARDQKGLCLCPWPEKNSFCSWVRSKASDGFAKREEYHLKAKDGNRFTWTMLLNGVSLELTEDGDIPPLYPVEVSVNSPIYVAPLTFAFVVFPDFEAEACGQ